jgi:hypothetical protein
MTRAPIKISVNDRFNQEKSKAAFIGIEQSYSEIF